MDNNYFDELFKSALQATPTYEASQEEMATMREKLRGQNRRSLLRSKLSNVLLISVLFISLLSGFLWFNSRLEQKISLLEEQLSHYQSFASTQLDTQYIYRIDTVYQSSIQPMPELAAPNIIVPQYSYLPSLYRYPAPPQPQRPKPPPACRRLLRLPR